MRSATGPAAWLAFEFTLVFIAVPAIAALGLIPVRPVPLICVAALVAVGVLQWLSPGAAIRRAAFRPAVRIVLLRTAAAGIALVGVAALAPGARLFGLVRHSPQNWAILMVLYPLLSALPQEVLFRVFLFRRYALLFPSPMAQVFASSVVFAFAHIIFASALTVLLSFIGGLLLSHTYLRSRSLWLVSIEHAVLGDLIFTVGLGAWFTYVPH